ncbi:MAG: type II toxin-antitoxin system HicA family toxin [Algicola sp.]|nr:type II toxin-antitoxin system HicA family toxin [Algicola sp.]
MGKHDKLVAKFLVATSGFKWNELVSLLIGLGYSLLEGSGSRVKFDNGDPEQLINVHRPHPGNELKAYALKQIRDKLLDYGLI